MLRAAVQGSVPQHKSASTTHCRLQVDEKNWRFEIFGKRGSALRMVSLLQCLEGLLLVIPCALQAGPGPHNEPQVGGYAGVH